MSRENNRRRGGIMVGRQVGWLILTLLTGQVRALTPTASTWGPRTRHSSFSLLALDHVIFTQHVLRDVPALSIMHCAQRCAETKSCVMATFHHSKPGGGGGGGGDGEGPGPARCRLFGKVHSLEGADPRENSPGARSFSLSGPTVCVPCPMGYEPQCGLCLKVSTDWLSYGISKNFCELDGGQLVMTKTLEDLICVRTFADSKDVSSFWVGADDRGTETFTWNDGTALPVSSPVWASGNLVPDVQEAGSNAVILSHAFRKLRVMHRLQDFYFVCENHC